LPRPGRHHGPTDIDEHEHHQHGNDKLRPAEEGHRPEIDDRRQQRHVEHHDLGIAERNRKAGKEKLRCGAGLRQRLARLVRWCRPHFPGEVDQIGDTRPFDDDERTAL
jgi:hypothetical protein